MLEINGMRATPLAHVHQLSEHAASHSVSDMDRPVDIPDLATPLAHVHQLSEHVASHSVSDIDKPVDIPDLACHYTSSWALHVTTYLPISSLIMPEVPSTCSYTSCHSVAGIISLAEVVLRTRWGCTRVPTIADGGSRQTLSPPLSPPKDPSGSRPTPEQPNELPDTLEHLLAIICAEVDDLVHTTALAADINQHDNDPYPAPQVMFCVCACMHVGVCVSVCLCACVGGCVGTCSCLCGYTCMRVWVCLLLKGTIMLLCMHIKSCMIALPRVVIPFSNHLKHLVYRPSLHVPATCT